MTLGRREFLAMPAFLVQSRATDARIEEIRTDFADFRYRAPYKFGGKEVDRVTLLNVHCRLATRAGKGAEGFDVSPDGRQLWTANAQDGTVTIIDLAAKKVSETFPIAVHFANRLKFSPDGRRVLISALGAFGASEPDHSNLLILDAASHAALKSLDLGGGAAGIQMAPDGSRAFVAVSRAGKVAVIDLKTLAIDGQVAPLEQPDGMAWVSHH